MVAVVTASSGFLEAAAAKRAFPRRIHRFPRACDRHRSICSTLGTRPAMVGPALLCRSEALVRACGTAGREDDAEQEGVGR